MHHFHTCPPSSLSPAKGLLLSFGHGGRAAFSHFYISEKYFSCSHVLAGLGGRRDSAQVPACPWRIQACVLSRLPSSGCRVLLEGREEQQKDEPCSSAALMVFTCGVFNWLRVGRIHHRRWPARERWCPPPPILMRKGSGLEGHMMCRAASTGQAKQAQNALFLDLTACKV